MALAPEEIKPTLNLADRDQLIKLNGEGRAPIVMFPNVDIEFGEPYLRSNRMQPQVFIPGLNGEPGETIKITPEVAKEISQFQRKLLLQ